ncbi:MAG: hypothetical protein HY566_03515, partial [Candidatus Kerfeldbacteria bacterium]|nr:hypothetical protein [Candidatus Kerfeldbacteria bacterium]
MPSTPKEQPPSFGDEKNVVSSSPAIPITLACVFALFVVVWIGWVARDGVSVGPVQAEQAQARVMPP